MSFLDITATAIAVGAPVNSELISLRSRSETRDDRVPHPSHRHAAPSAPWPWVDIGDVVDAQQLENSAPPIPDFCLHGESCNNCWTGYPQSRFPNWTYRQVVKSGIHRAITEYNRELPCILHMVDVDFKGIFKDAGTIRADTGNTEKVWKMLVADERPPNLRVRALFIQNLSGPILQMLGTKYNIEPFFWSSSFNWIPSRFQEEIQPGVGDHITITLTYLKSMSDHDAIRLGAARSTDTLNPPSTLLGTQKIDTHAPLVLYSESHRVLMLDLLSVHLIRNVNGSTIISYHPNMSLPTTSAPYFHTRIRFAGQSVYWQNIFQKSPDPTFIFLTFIWHALYAWDEALENLYDHICFLETRIMATSNTALTHELHVIRAHHLHYSSLLDDYAKHVDFIRDTKSPMRDSLREADQNYISEIMARECRNLSTEILRLQGELEMQEKRLKNVMGLVFSIVNINDSGFMKDLTAAAVKDSAGMLQLILLITLTEVQSAMKQIAYLTMAFLPASFVAAVFGMNVSEINPGTFGTLTKYLATALPLTVITAWVVTAFQYEAVLPPNSSKIHRLAWPVYFVLKLIQDRKKDKPTREMYSITTYNENGQERTIQ